MLGDLRDLARRPGVEAINDAPRRYRAARFKARLRAIHSRRWRGSRWRRWTAMRSSWNTEGETLADFVAAMKGKESNEVREIIRGTDERPC